MCALRVAIKPVLESSVSIPSSLLNLPVAVPSLLALRLVMYYITIRYLVAPRLMACPSAHERPIIGGPLRVCVTTAGPRTIVDLSFQVMANRGASMSVPVWYHSLAFA